MRTIGQKLKSTKLWLAIAGVLIGIALIAGIDANTIQTIVGAVCSIASTMTYIITEGKIDAASACDTIGEAGEAVNAVKELAGKHSEKEEVA